MTKLDKRGISNLIDELVNQPSTSGITQLKINDIVSVTEGDMSSFEINKERLKKRRKVDNEKHSEPRKKLIPVKNNPPNAVFGEINDAKKSQSKNVSENKRKSFRNLRSGVNASFKPVTPAIVRREFSYKKGDEKSQSKYTLFDSVRPKL